jgi:excisionase family DNA binding protein
MLMPVAKHNSNNISKLLLTAEDVAHRLSVGRATAYELMASGVLPVVRIGRSVRVPAQALDKWIEGKAKNPPRTNTS